MASVKINIIFIDIRHLTPPLLASAEVCALLSGYTSFWKDIACMSNEMLIACEVVAELGLVRPHFLRARNATAASLAATVIIWTVIIARVF